MGFYLRKSLQFGPFRFNLSTSGIGVSSGIPGFRIGTGPRGTFVHLGRGGLYYRQTLSAPRRNPPDRQKPDSSHPVEVGGTQGSLQPIGSASVSDMVDIDSHALLAQIQKTRKPFVFWPWALVATIAISVWLVMLHWTLWLTIPISILLLLGTIALHFVDQSRKTVVVMYDLDEDCAQAYQNLFRAMETLSYCGGLWQVTEIDDVYDLRRNAGAGFVVKRNRLAMRFGNPPGLITNLPVACLAFRHFDVYMLPDCLLVYGSNDVASISYETIELTSRRTQFVEEGPVPRDAQVIDHTWRFPCLDGTADLRFKNNYKIPVCGYEELEFTSTTGFHELVQISKLGVSSVVQSAFTSIAQAIRQARGATSPASHQDFSRETIVVDSHGKRVTAPIAPPLETEIASDDPGEVFFEILCCMAFADGSLSESETLAISQIMRKLNSSWSDHSCRQRIRIYFEDVDRYGYDAVLERSMTSLAAFKSTRYRSIMLKSVQIIASADKRLSKRERDLYRRVREILM